MNRVESNWDLFKEAIATLGSVNSDVTLPPNNPTPQGASQEVRVEPTLDVTIAPQQPIELPVAQQPLADQSPIASSLPAGSPSIPPHQPTNPPDAALVPLVERARDIDKLRHIFKHQVDSNNGISYEELRSHFPKLKPTHLSGLCQRVKKEGGAHCVGRRGNSFGILNSLQN